jgi:tetratricopeptide (TPR) repeat protein
LLVLGCDFIGNPQRLTAPARIVSGTLAAPALLGLFGLTWLCGGILARLEDDRAVGRSHDARCVAAVLGLALLAGAAGWLAIAWHFAAIVAAAPATVDRIADAVSRVARLVDVHYALLAALALVWALCLRPARLVVARHTAATAALSWPLAVAVPIVPFLVVDAFSLPPIRADILAKAGLAAERQARHGLAEELFARALALAPAEDVLWAMWGRARSSAAAAAADPRQRDAYFASAREALERARRIQPLHLDHTVGLARLMRDWGASTEEPALRGARLAEADGLYETASRLAPASAWLWNEWAAFLLRDLQRPDRARANLERSLVLDPLFEETRWLQDELLRAGQRGARD